MTILLTAKYLRKQVNFTILEGSIHFRKPKIGLTKFEGQFTKNIVTTYVSSVSEMYNTFDNILQYNIFTPLVK